MVKAIVISQQGSGTNLLRSFLNSHPDVFIHDEIFTRSDRYKIMLKSFGSNSVDKYLDEFFRTGKGFGKKESGNIEPGYTPKVLGFDLKYNNIVGNNLIWDWLIANREDIKIIHLRRCKGRTFLRMMNKKNEAQLSWEALERHIKFVGDWEKKIEQISKDFHYKCFSYEDMTRGYEISILPKDFEERLLNFLEVEQRHLTINLEAVREDKIKMRY